MALLVCGEDSAEGLEGFAETSADNLLASIDATKNRPLPQVIAALGIQGVGGVVARTLARHFGSIDELRVAGREQLEEIEGIGPHTAEVIVAWFSRGHNRDFVNRLQAAGVNMKRRRPVSEGAGPLDSLTFVITGTLSQPRRKVTGSVSGNTDFLVTGDSPGRSKVIKAEELGTPRIGEVELRKLIEGAGS